MVDGRVESLTVKELKVPEKSYPIYQELRASSALLLARSFLNRLIHRAVDGFPIGSG